MSKSSILLYFGGTLQAVQLYSSLQEDGFGPNARACCRFINGADEPRA
jgi:hypothetical protein